MRIRLGPLTTTLFALSVLMALAAVRIAVAAPQSDPIQVLNSFPPTPANVASAGMATQAGTDSGSPVLIAAAYDALNVSIKATAFNPAGSVGGIDISRASSDPAYAAQVQARMQSMSMAEKMAMASQMQSAAASGSSPAVAAFVGRQRPADIAAQQKIRTLLDSALTSAGAKHRAIDDALNASAKACPQDKTGWPLASCTGPLGVKSIAQHRAVEEAALASEGQALVQAKAIAMVELSKGRDLYAQASGPSGASLMAWGMTYVQLLSDYGKAITLRAGFWAHADASKYTGMVTDYIHSPGGEIYWPLGNSAYGPQVGVGLR